jgi:protein SCO1/2
MNSCLGKIIITVLASIACIAVAYWVFSREKNLPIYEPGQVNPELVDAEIRGSKNHRVQNFKLWDQNGNVTDSTFTQGKIHVADFFFTTCQSICPRMSASMESVSSEFDPVKDDVRFLSFSVIPEEDSIPALKNYAIGYNVNYANWRLLTGAKEDIYSLARKSYFTLKPSEVGQGDGGMSDFIHTNNFVLVDRDKRIRGYYDGTSVLDMKRLSKDVKNLLNDKP